MNGGSVLIVKHPHNFQGEMWGKYWSLLYWDFSYISGTLNVIEVKIRSWQLKKPAKLSGMLDVYNQSSNQSCNIRSPIFWAPAASRLASRGSMRRCAPLGWNPQWHCILFFQRWWQPHWNWLLARVWPIGSEVRGHPRCLPFSIKKYPFFGTCLGLTYFK